MSHSWSKKILIMDDCLVKVKETWTQSLKKHDLPRLLLQNLIGGAGEGPEKLKAQVLTCQMNDELLELHKETVDVTKWSNFQMVRKICLNSLYGALGNNYFRYYKLENAEAVTSTGQVTIRWIERKLNEFVNKALGTEDEDYVIASDTDSYLS